MAKGARRVRRSFKYQIRPTAKQLICLDAMLQDHRGLYNAALQERRDAHRHASGTHVRYVDQSAQLKAIRAFDPEQSRWSFSSQQATLRRLDRAFQAFYRRVKSGDSPGYPRFKGANRFDTIDFPKDGDGCRWDSVDNPTQTRVRLQGVGHVKVNLHRPIVGTVKTISVKREGARWYVILSCDDVPVLALPQTGAVVGVDMGIASFLTTSDGAHILNPRHLAKAAACLVVAQRDLARKKRGSRRRRKAVERVANLHRTVRRARLDHAHKVALGLVRDNDLIAVEALRIANMTKRAAPRLDPDRAGAFLPNKQAAKSGLNKSILDAGWGVFLDVLRAKAESAGRVIVEVPAQNTSRTCSTCGHCAVDNRKAQAAFACVACGYAAHADVNAAINILRAGLVLQAAQAA